MKANRPILSGVISFPGCISPNSINPQPSNYEVSADSHGLEDTEREHLSEELDQYRPYLATALGAHSIAVLGDFTGDGVDEVRMFQFDAGMAGRVKECWELLREVRFVASMEQVAASEQLQNAEAFFGRVQGLLVIILVGDTLTDGDDAFYAFVEAPELLCRLGRPEHVN